MHRRVACAVVALSFAVGCEKRVDSPKPALTSVMPQIVCNAQLTTPVAVAGSNLTPLPIRTLGHTDTKLQTLQLPALSLTLSANLDGSTASGTAVAIPDDFDAPDQSHVKWQSESAMSFDVFPGLMLQEGVHDLTVANPDGQSVTLAHALAVVPPPRVTKIEPSALCDAQSDQTVVITGVGFLQINGETPRITVTPAAGGTAKVYTPTKVDGCVDIATSVAAGFKACTSLTFVIKQNDLAPGDYLITVSNPAPAGCASTETIRMKVSPPPHITDVTPRHLCVGGGTLDVKGMDFQMGAKVELGTWQASRVDFLSAMELQAGFGGNSPLVPMMSYKVKVTNPDGCNDTLMAPEVTIDPGPILFFADPPVVYNGVTTQETLYSTSIAIPLGSVTMTLSDGSGTPIVLQAMIDPKHPKRILTAIPKGTPAGEYDVTVVDGNGCPATLVKAIKVVDKTTLTITGITPNFGWQNDTTAVTITAAGGLTATPRVYLNPHNPGANVATALGSIAFISPMKVAAVVPKGLDPALNPYDVIVVNPDGGVGILTMPLDALYRSTTLPPPVIDSISPGAVPSPNPPPVTIFGANFRQPKVTFNCITDIVNGTRMDFAATVGSSTATTITIPSPPVGTLATPSLCTIRVTNGDDQTFATFSALAISNSSGNLSAPKAATALPAARRAPALLGSAATRANHFLYVIGGDNGMPAGALDTVISISTDENGTGAQWSTQHYKLNKPRTLAGYTSLGRYLYVAGGNDGTGPVETVERAMVLDPLQAPTVNDVDIFPSANGMGLGGGAWFYRVAAVMDANDPDNPNGETLPSDVVSLLLPDLMQKLQVTLTWSAVPGAAGYRIYRTPTANLIAGQEQLLAEVAGGNTIEYTDQGQDTMAGSPLAQGSTGRWRVLPAMGSKRESPGVAFGTDPNDATKQYLYATLGRGPMAALGTYEFLPVTVGNGGQQTVGNAWSGGNSPAGTARYQHSIFSADHNNCSFIPAGSNYIYLGGGTANGTSAVQSLDVAKVTAGGQLGGFAPAGTATVKSFGQGFTVAANYLYGFGDDAPSATIFAGQIDQGAVPSVRNYNNNGGTLLTARYLPGTALQGALIYLAGGSNAGRSSATTSVEWMIW